MTHADPDFAERLDLIGCLLWHGEDVSGFSSLDVAAARLVEKWRRDEREALK
jgi:hypothetical protein